MAYEYEDEVKSVISTETVFSHEETEKEARVKELQEVYRKAKAFDEIKEFIVRKLKEEEEQYLSQSEQDVGQYKAYNYIDDIIQEHLEDKQND